MILNFISVQNNAIADLRAFLSKYAALMVKSMVTPSIVARQGDGRKRAPNRPSITRCPLRRLFVASDWFWFAEQWITTKPRHCGNKYFYRNNEKRFWLYWHAIFATRVSLLYGFKVATESSLPQPDITWSVCHSDLSNLSPVTSGEMLESQRHQKRPHRFA